MTLRILYEDNHLLVVDKPAGLLTQGDRTGEPTLIDLARAYRKEREHKVGNAYVGLVHRLDKLVGGVVVLAKTSKAAARLSTQFRTRTVTKAYLAVVELRGVAGRTLPSTNPVTWEDDLARQETSSRPVRRQRCRTLCRMLHRRGSFALLELSPQTGRKHQLRVQCSMRGWPIVGDRLYGSKTKFPGIALHAAALRITHPIQPHSMTFRSSPPDSWIALPFGRTILRATDPALANHPGDDVT